MVNTAAENQLTYLPKLIDVCIFNKTHFNENSTMGLAGQPLGLNCFISEGVDDVNPWRNVFIVLQTSTIIKQLGAPF